MLYALIVIAVFQGMLIIMLVSRKPMMPGNIGPDKHAILMFYCLHFNTHVFSHARVCNLISDNKTSTCLTWGTEDHKKKKQELHNMIFFSPQNSRFAKLFSEEVAK